MTEANRTEKQRYECVKPGCPGHDDWHDYCGRNVEVSSNLEVHWFHEIMAVMHRDGGHYLAEHGPQKAANDAIAAWYERQAEIERQAGVIERLRTSFWQCGNHFCARYYAEKPNACVCGRGQLYELFFALAAAPAEGGRKMSEPTFCCGNDAKCAGGCDCQCHSMQAEISRLQRDYARDGNELGRLQMENARLRAALELIASPLRPDGTWNRNRKACQLIASEALRGADETSERQQCIDQAAENGSDGT